MRKFFKFALCVALTTALGLNFSSCSDDDIPAVSDETNNKELKDVLTQYVDNTVIPTYCKLADATITVEKACKNLYDKKVAGTATTSDVQSVCDAWISSRKYWEQSEAFLLGPATIKGIDPHIDSWPLDKTALDKLLANNQIMEDLDASYITTNYGSGGLCGFHALEYVIFEGGKAKVATKITANEAKYAYAVAGDLMLQCIYLETAWAGFTQVTPAKQIILRESDAIPDNDTDSWATHFRNAGNAGSRYKTQMEAIVDFLKADKACFGIANEVGDTKIADPVGSQNVLDVESWYSYNSKVDFQDNIRGIQNVIMGGIGNKRDENKSIYSYLKSRNATLAQEMKDAINNCIGEDGKTGLGTIIYPFRNNLEPAKNRTAIESCQLLRDKLAQVATYLQEH